MTTSDRPPRARLPLSYWVVAVGLPLIAGAVAVALQLAWLPQLPDPIAIHWGQGGPDGFGAPWSSLALTAGLAVGLTAMFAGFLATARGAAPTVTHKLLAVLSLVTALFVGGTVTASVAVQRGLDDARDAPGIDGLLGLALLGSLLVGVVAWFMLPKAVRTGTDATPARPVTLVPGERSAWIATTRVPTGALAAILGGLGIVLAAAVFAIAISDGALWPIAIAPLLLLVLASIGTVWRVRVDATGLLVRSLPFGWPRLRIPATEIVRVSTAHVDPLAEFGGWGWRWSPGNGFGVVTRGGEAIEVMRSAGRRFVVTVDDAATGAALLAAYTASATENRERYPQTGSARGNG